MKTFKYFLTVILILLTNKIVFTQTAAPDKIVDVKVLLPHGVPSSGVVDAEVILNVKKGWHINANKPLDKDLSPTVLSFKETEGIQVLKITYPEPSLEKLPVSESQLALYEDEVIIKVRLKVDKKRLKQPLALEGEVKYQPCNNQTCLFPASKPFSIDLNSRKKK